MDNGSTIVLQRLHVKVGPERKLGEAFSCDLNHVTERKKSVERSLCQNECEDKRNLHRCGMCREVFLSIHDICNHLKQHHFQIQAYDCGVCLHFFPFHAELEAHLLDDHLQSDCGPTPVIKAPSMIDVGEIEAFMKNSEMREKVELKCPLCGCVYNKLAQYQDHMSASHRGKAWDKDGLCSAVLKVTTVKGSSVKPMIRDDPTEVAPGKVYTCARCDQKVYGREPMKRHAATHNENEIIQCTTCCEFFITQAAYKKHKQQAHLTLSNLKVKHLNEHGDIRGESIDDILKANDCLSKACLNEQDKPDETIYIDLDTKCTIIHETVQVKSHYNDICKAPCSVSKPSLEIQLEEMNGDTGKTPGRPDWKTHKRERSDDSLPDPNNPMYNLLLLSKSAIREQKRLAVEGQGNGSDGEKQIKFPESATPDSVSFNNDFAVIDKLVCEEKLLEKGEFGDDKEEEEGYKARFYLSVFYALTGLAALATCHLKEGNVI